ncbi:tyrosine-type recombinase/integrase [Granulicella sibirica]|uniref:tyrosine-type recombinase/integrase n=1 Tax=Granulicella sibirica TaxID=2479048 RepID=UPI003BAC2676
MEACRISSCCTFIGAPVSSSHERYVWRNVCQLISPVFVRQGPRFEARSWFVPCLQDAEIEGYVWHCNRHTFCSWLAMAGASIKEIQELAGHKTITMSARYSHLSPEHRLSVIDRISSINTK